MALTEQDEAGELDRMGTELTAATDVKAPELALKGVATSSASLCRADASRMVVTTNELMHEAEMHTMERMGNSAVVGGDAPCYFQEGLAQLHEKMKRLEGSDEQGCSERLPEAVSSGEESHYLAPPASGGTGRRASRSSHRRSRREALHQISRLNSCDVRQHVLKEQAMADSFLWLRQSLLWLRWRKVFAALVPHKVHGEVLCLFHSQGGSISLKHARIVSLRGASVTPVGSYRVGTVTRPALAIRQRRWERRLVLAASSTHARDWWLETLARASKGLPE